jgi:uncharacterized protein (TIGR02646 family)
MIRVSQGPLPAHFDATVKTPGLAFLTTTPAPTGAQWKGHDYWRAVKRDLHRYYRGVCNYCVSWTPEKSGSVDHYVPKGKNAALAYDWSNYRYARAVINTYKDSFEDVLDPFVIQNDWFRLDFTTMFVKPHASRTGDDRKRVWDTINRLRLNTDNVLLNERAGVVYKYAANKITWDYVEKCYPFIALQMAEQDFEKTLRPAFLKVLAARPWLAN